MNSGGRGRGRARNGATAAASSGGASSTYPSQQMADLHVGQGKGVNRVLAFTSHEQSSDIKKV
jgi:hypothetical protein